MVGGLELAFRDQQQIRLEGRTIRRENAVRNVKTLCEGSEGRVYIPYNTSTRVNLESSRLFVVCDREHRNDSRRSSHMKSLAVFFLSLRIELSTQVESTGTTENLIRHSLQSHYSFPN